MNFEPFVVLLPLFGAMLAMPTGRWLGHRAAEIVTTSLMALAALYAWVLFADVAIGHHARTIPLFTWISSGNFVAEWAVRLDTLSATMLVVVNSVSFLVHAYSIGYMHDDKSRSRFFAYLSLFTFAMLCLVTANDFVQLFFGWEGVGLASYLLIGFYFKKKSANDAAIKAFVVNRVGDFGFALGIFCVFYVFQSVRFDDVFAAIVANDVVTPYAATAGAPILELTINIFGMEAHALTAMAMLLFVGAMGKSAQFFLHTWLPDAMEGPTPVSALIHAATMVTAGVFLVCRCSVMYENAPDAAALVTLVGAVTAFFAATVGLLQNDIKKIIAYSTCSQLGYMFFAAGVGAYGAAMFHLFTHAFFKALLFLGAGAVIHGMHHEQDIKKMGGVRALLPLTHVFMLIGTVAIIGVGIPGLKLFGAPIGTAGFVSKDMILESAYAAGVNGRAFGYFAFVIGLIAAVFTAFYSWRLIVLTFWGPSRAPEAVRKHPHEVPTSMLAPLAPLALGALFAGMAFYPQFVGKKADAFWNGALANISVHIGDTHGTGHASAPEAGHGATTVTHDGAHDGADASHGPAGADDAAHDVAPKNATEHATEAVDTDTHEGATVLASDSHDAAEAGHGEATDTDGSHGEGAHGESALSEAAHGESAHGDAEGEGGHGFPAWVLWAPLIAMLTGTTAALMHYMGDRPFKPGILREGGMIYGFLKNKWYFDQAYDLLFVRPAIAFGRFLWKQGDGRTIDGLGPDGIAAAIAGGARRLVKIQTGYMYHYAFAMLVGIAVFLTYLLMRTGGGQ